MEFLLSRYRNLTVLLIVIVAQLVLIAYQVKADKDVPLIRVWAVTAVTPVEQALEFVRRNTIGRVEDYFYLLGVRSENERLNKEVGELKLQNNYLRNEVAMADRARALVAFQQHSPSKTLAAQIIGNGTGANSKVVFVDRGSASGVEAGMAVITPDGIVGKVLSAYPTASLVMLVTDPTFAAGVVSQKNHVRGTLKGQGHGTCIVDYVQNEQKVDVGEWFYTSGDDRIFPRGFPAGKVDVVRNGKTFKEIYVTPSAFQGAPDEVLIVLEGVHELIPDTEIASPGYKLLPPPPDAGGQKAQAGDSSTSVLTTDADRLKEEYKAVGQAQNHVFGEGLPGSKPPDFTKLGVVPANLVPPKPGAPAAPGSPAAAAKPAQPAPGPSGSPGPKPANATAKPPASPPAAKAAAGAAAPGTSPSPKPGNAKPAADAQPENAPAATEAVPPKSRETAPVPNTSGPAPETTAPATPPPAATSPNAPPKSDAPKPDSPPPTP